MRTVCLSSVRTDLGVAWALTRDEADLRSAAGPQAPARLLPSGDAYLLLWGPDRELVVPDPDHRAALWTSRVWPGDVLVHGEVVGTWRRAADEVTVSPWARLDRGAHEVVEREASSLPLPGVSGPIRIRWDH